MADLETSKEHQVLKELLEASAQKADFSETWFKEQEARIRSLIAVSNDRDASTQTLRAVVTVMNSMIEANKSTIFTLEKKLDRQKKRVKTMREKVRNASAMMYDHRKSTKVVNQDNEKAETLITELETKIKDYKSNRGRLPSGEPRSPW